MQRECDCVGVDWGTTHRRMYALDKNGQALGSLADSEGASACRGRFAQSLAGGLQELEVMPQKVVMSGMVGSSMGWQLVPYVDGSVALPDLPQQLVRIQDPLAPVPAWVLPGYCIRDEQGQPDVMRGEETQLLGAWAMGHHSGLFVLPGTHSKWVNVQQGRITQLRTYMTGELFSLLCSHGTLAAAAGGDQQWDSAVFDQSVRAGMHGGLSGQLFQSRARVVCSDMEACHVHCSLSGLLIGSELSDAMDKAWGPLSGEPIRVLGSHELTRHYQRAAQLMGHTVVVIDPNAAYLQGLSFIQRQASF